MNHINSNNIVREKGKYLFAATGFAEPIMDHGEGSWVWDVDGNKYLDLNAGQFCLTFGHNYQPLKDVVLKQLGSIYHTNTGTLSANVFDAAEKMAKVSGGRLNKTIFLSTGSEANECAIRYARFVTGRGNVICLSSGYHGLTLGSQSVTMGGQWALPRISETKGVKVPDYIHEKTDLSEEEFVDVCINELKNTFEESGDSIAAMILEPIVGVGGMVKIPPRYLQVCRDLCNEYGAVLIFDECQCGFGRSGNYFVFQDDGVEPDILVTAKAMGLGFAVSAVTFSEEVADRINGRLTHFSSHQNDPLSAAIVSFVIDEIERLSLLDSNKKKGKRLYSSLKQVCDVSDNYLINPREYGLMCAFDLNDSIINDYRKFSTAFSKKIEDNGVLIQAIRQGRTFRLMPNYLIKDDEIDYVGEAMKKSIKEMLA